MAYNYQSAKTQEGRDALIAFSTGRRRMEPQVNYKNASRPMAYSIALLIDKGASYIHIRATYHILFPCLLFQMSFRRSWLNAK